LNYLINFKNHFKDDHSRVILKGCPDTDYINANYVECEEAKRRYILTQGPLKTTCEHFWQMVWEQNSKGIVMLNRIIEKQSNKCEMYYPNLDEINSELEIEFGKFRLNYLSERPMKDYVIREIECENMEQKEKRIIFHCHFVNWPDFGEPEYPTMFLQFLNSCKELNIFNTEEEEGGEERGVGCGPPIIHCSAGVGRSGTFILVDSMIQLFKQYKNEMPMGPDELLAKFRSYRLGLVQTQQQLKFAYEAIIQAIIQDNDQNKSLMQSNNRINSTLETDEYSDSDEDDDSNSDDDNDDDDDGWNDDDDDNENKEKKQKITSNRPDTAAKSSSDNKKFKTSENSKKRIQKLRQTQLKNGKSYRNQQNIINNSNNNDDTDDTDDPEDNTTIFNSIDCNIETVKVNEKRKPLNHITINDKNENSNETIINKLEIKKTQSTPSPAPSSLSFLKTQKDENNPTSPQIKIKLLGDDSNSNQINDLTKLKLNRQYSNPANNKVNLFIYFDIK
jgi:protein tyrosine phosphatase